MSVGPVNQSLHRHGSRFGKAFAIAFAVALLSACSTAHYFINPRLEAEKGESAYAMRNLGPQGNTDSLLVLVAISGGGYRAAALGYGVLAALRDTPIEWEGAKRTMLDEVDFITGVSGGALIAAYFMTFREETFTRFEREVLALDLQHHVLARTLSPRGLWRQTSRRFGRGDVLAELLDEHVFKGKTYGDVPRRRPMGIINATDLEFGGRFEFSQDQFDHVCADLDAFPVSRAVAASMAVPLLLSPVTLWNYTNDCPLARQPLVLKSQAGRSRYIHLLDAGLADNTGVQTPLELISVRGGIIESAKAAGLSGIKKRVFIIVNAQANEKFDEDSLPDTPTLLRQLRAVVDVPIDRYSAASIELLKQEVVRWRADLRAASDEQLGGIVSRDTDFFVIEVSLSAPPPDFDIRALSGIPTSLRISEPQSKALQRYARQALESNPEWKHLMGLVRPASAGTSDSGSSRSEPVP